MTPDPTLTASVYCNRRLDHVVSGLVIPFRERLRELDREERWALWMVRYSGRGDHLKLRLHGPEEERERVRAFIAEEAGRFFAALEPAVDEPRVSRAGIPAIDEEDEGEGEHPDRALLWTRYRRSHVSLGPHPFLADDRYAAGMAAALGAGAAMVLAAFAAHADGQLPAAARQRTLLKAVIAGLAEAGLSPERCAAYLAYHRDWLLRFFAEDAEREAEVRDGLDRQVAAMAPAVEQLRTVVAGEWAPGRRADTAWNGTLAALAAYVRAFEGDPAYRVDPFAADPLFPPVFKVFHGVANQLGLSPVNEAFVHHLLLQAARDGAAVAEA
ncbi:MAG TPA: lantibiotic dehydratase C-terminal domain-containing protein [Longimicrobium sp.]|nr:lantibiotic dehydratase C-terminal domain-containing protein [Longimicrobium sp.]